MARKRSDLPTIAEWKNPGFGNRDPYYLRAYRLKTKFNLDFDDYKALLIKQDEKCAICTTDDPGQKDWHVDMNHETKKVRGLLCNRCNIGIGYFGEEVVLLNRVWDYMTLRNMKYFRVTGDKTGVVGLGRKDPRYYRAYMLLRNVGMTLSDYDRLFEREGGRCAICGTTDSGQRDFHVDHCHDTGHVRGLLCGRCNIGLGYFRNDEEIMKRAVIYLSSF